MTSGSAGMKGGKATSEDLKRQEMRDTAAAPERGLETVRAAATKWQVALAGLAGSVTAFSLVKGRSDVQGLRWPWNVVSGAALAVSLALAVLAGLLAMRAAFGLPVIMRADKWPEAGLGRSRKALNSLRWAIGLTVVSVVGLAAAVAMVWYAPVRPSSTLMLRVVQQDGLEFCGMVVDSEPGTLTLSTPQGTHLMELEDISGLAPVVSCGTQPDLFHRRAPHETDRDRSPHPQGTNASPDRR